ncbi:MAG: hypothetical protein PUE51_13450, partial [Veillonellaceae bacterium]|nr:hypothetical protein [Veillonellaceae bacterium]
SNAGCHGARTPKTTAKRESHLIPIDAPPGVLMGIFSVLGYVMLLGAYHETNVLDTIWIVLFFVGVCVGGYIIGKMIWNSIQTHNKEAAVARDRWKHSYICMRCGARFIIR